LTGRPVALKEGKDGAYSMLAEATLARIAEVGGPKGPKIEIEE